MAAFSKKVAIGIQQVNLTMNIVGEEYLRTCISQQGYFLKLVVNERVAHFFPYTIEHREASLPGLTYRDNSEGNALAATIKPSQIDVRMHSAFSVERIKLIAAQLENTLGGSSGGVSFAVKYGDAFVTSINLCSQPESPPT